MKNLFVSAGQSYQDGFVLNESELRRISQMILEQLRKGNPDEEPKLDFVLLYKNGAVLETDQIENLLAEENSGSTEITGLKLYGSIGVVERPKEDSGERRPKREKELEEDELYFNL